MSAYREQDVESLRAQIKDLEKKLARPKMKMPNVKDLSNNQKGAAFLALTFILLVSTLLVAGAPLVAVVSIALGVATLICAAVSFLFWMTSND